MSKEKKTRSELGQMILAELHALGIADVKRLVISENYETSVRYSWNILGWWRDSADEHSVARALERIVPRLQKQFDLDHA